MRVLFTTWNWVSHLDPMVPLAVELRSAGHEVMIAGQPGLASAVAGVGLDFAPVGSDLEVAARFRDFVLPPAALAPARPAAPVPGALPQVPRVLGIFADLAQDMAPELSRFVRTWESDLVIFESTCWAGWVGASAAGVPAYRFSYGVDLVRPMREQVSRLVEPVGTAVGATRHDPYTAPLIDPCPRALQLPGAGPTLRMRYVPQHTGYSGVAAFPRGCASRICVTWGTTMSRLGAEYFLLPQVLRQLGELPDVELIAAVSAAARPLLGELPSTVSVVESAPLSQVLPGCDLVVAHGGAGTMLTAAVHGIPQLLVPQLPDHAGHAQRLVAAGAGLACPRSAVADGSLRAVAGALLGRREKLAAARSLATEIARAPSPAEIAARLERTHAEQVDVHNQGRRTREKKSCSLNYSRVPAGG
jgi:Protein of unknown function (DUF1205)